METRKCLSWKILDPFAAAAPEKKHPRAILPIRLIDLIPAHFRRSEAWHRIAATPMLAAKRECLFRAPDGRRTTRSVCRDRARSHFPEWERHWESLQFDFREFPLPPVLERALAWALRK